MKEGLPSTAGRPDQTVTGFGSRRDGEVMTPRCAGVDGPLVVRCPLPSPAPLRWCGGVIGDASHVRAFGIPFLSGRDVAQLRCTTEVSRHATHPRFCRGGGRDGGHPGASWTVTVTFRPRSRSNQGYAKIPQVCTVFSERARSRKLRAKTGSKRARPKRRSICATLWRRSSPTSSLAESS